MIIVRRCFIICLFIAHGTACRAAERNRPAVRTTPRSIAWSDKNQTLTATGRWVSGASCASGLPSTNVAMIECDSLRCREHVAVVFGTNDTVDPAWSGLMLMDAHEYLVTKWGSVIEGRTDEPSGPSSLYIDVARKLVRRVRRGSSPCEFNLE
jgi:hypothetical protein